MRNALILIGAMVLSGCSDTKNAPADPEVEEIIAGHPGMTKACSDKVRAGGGYPEIFDAQCYEMMPARHWKGIWNRGWEWSNFCPQPATDCDVSHRDDEMDLRFAEGVYPEAGIQDGVYSIEFVGRRTKIPGRHGHLSQYPHVLVVDRMISMRRIDEKK